MASGFDPNRHYADNVLSQIEIFVEKFRDIREPGELRSALNSEELHGGTIGQTPEHFTEKYLIQPILTGLGYKDPDEDSVGESVPQVQSKPAAFPKIEQKLPDFKLENVHPELICIVESKAINREPLEGPKKEATTDIQEYLRSNTFSKFAREECGYLVGIATDGWRWSLWAKDLEQASIRENIGGRRSIEPVVAEVANAKLYDGTDEYDRVELRNKIQEELTEVFSVKSLPDHVLDGLNRFKF